MNIILIRITADSSQSQRHSNHQHNEGYRKILFLVSIGCHLFIKHTFNNYIHHRRKESTLISTAVGWTHSSLSSTPWPAHPYSHPLAPFVDRMTVSLTWSTKHIHSLNDDPHHSAPYCMSPISLCILPITFQPPSQKKYISFWICNFDFFPILFIKASLLQVFQNLISFLLVSHVIQNYVSLDLLLICCKNTVEFSFLHVIIIVINIVYPTIASIR